MVPVERVVVPVEGCVGTLHCRVQDARTEQTPLRCFCSGTSTVVISAAR